MYCIGTRVKIFIDCFYAHTETGIISYVKFLPDKNGFGYLVTLDNGKGKVLVEDEDIIKPYEFQLKLQNCIT